jgi:hypothetical protein
MTLSQLIAQFRTEVMDTAAVPFWTDAEVMMWLNEAQDEACIRKRLIRDRSTTAICTINIVAGTPTYAIDSRIICIERAEIVIAGSVGMMPWVLVQTSHATMDRLTPNWRWLTVIPSGFIHNDTTIEVCGKPNNNYTMTLDVFRLPIAPMALPTDAPEISAKHHRHLVKWAKYRAYEKQDSDTQDVAKSAQFLAQFEDVFGKQVDADTHRQEYANTPHRTRTY